MADLLLTDLLGQTFEWGRGSLVAVGELRARYIAALRAADSLVILPSDPAAAAEEIQRRREEIGFSYFVIGADFADTLAPVVAKLAGQ